jgi:sigma-B regulation protein RsbU (phosphoserine phosphatase)
MSTGRTYWKTIPLNSLLVFLLGVFLLFSTIGFASDVPEMGRQPQLRFVLGVLASGIFSVFYAFAGFALRKQWWKAIVPIMVVHFALMLFLANKFPDRPQPAMLGSPEIEALNHRLFLEALTIIIAVILGYVCFLYVSITEFRRYFRLNAEIELAGEIHRVLVPAIHTRIGGFEFYGSSLPSGQVGGDLIDLAGTTDSWVAYVADVSGHGVAPGVVMGMVKSASRMLLTSAADSEQLMSRLNEVLYPLKKPDMFVTFCYVAKKGEQLRLGLAGHPAILQFCARSNEVKKWDCPNMPLGILPEGEFVNSEVAAEHGDLFALYTDGLLETTNAAGEEFGIERFTNELCRHANEPLESICRSLRESVAQHGAQFDDQSLLLLRHL